MSRPFQFFDDTLKPARFGRLLTCVLALLCQLHSPGSASAENPASAADPTVTTESAGSAVDGDKALKPGPCDRMHDTHEYEETWYDLAHDYMNTKFCEPVVWFDDFFATDRVLEEVGGTYVRWQNDFVLDEEDGFEFKPNLSFSVEVPKISRRLKLTFEGDEDQQLTETAPDGTASSPNSLGLRFDFFDETRHSFNIRATLSPRLTLRYRYTYPIRQDLVFRFTQEVENRKGTNGTKTRVDLEKSFLPRFVLRWTSEGQLSEDYDGVNWLTSLVLFQRLTKKSSISYESGINGISEPDPLITNTRLGIRFRRNIHRDWLFFEITPDITWPIDLSEDRESVLEPRRSKTSITFRLEIHFGNAKKKKYSDYVQRKNRDAAQMASYYLWRNSIYH